MRQPPVSYKVYLPIPEGPHHGQAKAATVSNRIRQGECHIGFWHLKGSLACKKERKEHHEADHGPK
jgi:hypothetical protein